MGHAMDEPRAAGACIVVVGAGVIGLTTALELRAHGHEVHVVARDMPHDAASTQFASPWAGANCVSYASDDDLLQQRWERTTWQRLAGISRRHPDLVQKIPFELFSSYLATEQPWWKNMVEEFGLLPPSEPGASSPGLRFNSWVLDVPSYLLFLADELAAPASDGQMGPPATFHRVDTLDSLGAALDVVPQASLIVNASALGSRWLSDVLDEKVVPARGQTVLVRAPHVRTCYIDPAGLSTSRPSHASLPPNSELMEEAAKSQPTYIIPRAGSGQVILGGTFEAGWANEAVTSEATTERILRDCIRLCPALDGCEVISVNVGLRPVRLGGTRLEPDRLANGVDVVHCYGAGPAGYQQSWGQAEHVAELVTEILAQRRSSHHSPAEELAPQSPRL